MLNTFVLLCIFLAEMIGTCRSWLFSREIKSRVVRFMRFHFYDTSINSYRSLGRTQIFIQVNNNCDTLKLIHPNNYLDNFNVVIFV